MSRKGTKHRAALDIWKDANNVYYNGTHADYQALSVYHRPADRNNQALEGAHRRSIAMGLADANESARGSFERWLNAAKAEELYFANRQYALENLNAPPKTKDKALIIKDKQITKIVEQHKKNQITTKELLASYMKYTNENELPRNLRHFSARF